MERSMWRVAVGSSAVKPVAGNSSVTRQGSVPRPTEPGGGGQPGTFRRGSDGRRRSVRNEVRAGRLHRGVGIVDVAAAAGVSRQTVSNVLNGHVQYFSQATYDRVVTAMRELGYQPNRAAQTLRSRRSMQIAYHMFGEQLESVNGFFLHFLQALVKEAAAGDYQIVVFTHQGTDPSPAFSELIARRNVDAFIVSESAVDDPRVRLLADNKIPFACLGKLAGDLPQQWVDVDNVAGMVPLVEYLVGKGHRTFAFLAAAGDEYWKRDRLAGLVQGLAAHRITLPDDRRFTGTDADIRTFAKRLMLRKTRPSAIVCGSDAVAAVVVNVAHSLGLRPGEDIAITGFDGGAIGLMTEPTLTSVRIPIDLAARELVQRCRKEIEIGPTGEPGLVLATELVVGGSA